jgi:hypothetical protein
MGFNRLRTSSFRAHRTTFSASTSDTGDHGVTFRRKHSSTL